MLIRNAAASLAGQLVQPLLALVLVPFYIRHLGLEGYGLIGLMALVVSLLSVFSRGLGGAVQREVSRRLTSEDAATGLKRLLRSTELLYWAAAGVILVVLSALALSVSSRWVEVRTLTSREVEVCMLLLAVRVAAAFPHSVYQSVLIGSERQVLGSVLNAALALASAAAGVSVVLTLGSITAFYAAEVVVASIFLFVYRYFAYRVLPPGVPVFAAAEIRGLLGISAALMWTSGVGLLISTLDRVVVGSVMPVAALGVYTIAAMGGRLVTLIFNPFFQVAYPQMCRAVHAGTIEGQVRDLERNQAVILLITAAAGLPLSLFAREVLTLWVGVPAVVASATPVLAIYVLGSLLIAFATVLYQWQTATGRTSTAVKFNAAALVWFPVTLVVLVSQFGLVGGALAWTLYGALSWVMNLMTTFGPDALPVGGRWASLRLTAMALTPAALIVVAARVVADAVFPHVLWARVTCAAAAGLLGSLAAFMVVRAPLLAGNSSGAAAALAQPTLGGVGGDNDLIRSPEPPGTS